MLIDERRKALQRMNIYRDSHAVIQSTARGRCFPRLYEQWRVYGFEVLLPNETPHIVTDGR